MGKDNIGLWCARELNGKLSSLPNVQSFGHSGQVILFPLLQKN